MADDEFSEPPPPDRNWTGLGRSILNGLVGDYLVAQDNPLAIEMGFVRGGRPQGLVPGLPAWSDVALTGRVVLLLHGLTNRETIFDFDGSPENYGTRLRARHGFSPFYLRYNTGLPVAENGRRFFSIMEDLRAVYPVPIREIVILGFSMGGLIARVAQNLPEASSGTWVDQLTKCVYLGTPHQGARLERLGATVAAAVQEVPVESVRQWASWIDTRSQGIQDLRYGLDPDAEFGYRSGVEHFFVSGALSKTRHSLLNRILGDGLVDATSAAPASLPEGSRSAHFDGVGHLKLASSEEVGVVLEEWLVPAEAESSQALAPSPPIAAPSSLAPKVRLGAEARKTAVMVAGAMDLAADALQQTVDAVEGTHLAISRGVHGAVQRVPAVRPFSAAVEAVSDVVTKGCYASVRTGGAALRVAARGVKRGAQDPEDPEETSE